MAAKTVLNYDRFKKIYHFQISRNSRLNITGETQEIHDLRKTRISEIENNLSKIISIKFERCMEVKEI